MVKNNQSVAKTILDQLGGNKFLAMIGASNIVGGKNYVAMEFRGCKKYNNLKIELMPSDLYNVSFIKIRGMKFIRTHVHTGIYHDMLQNLFTEVTGLYTHL